MIAAPTPRTIAIAAVIALLALVPVYAHLVGNLFVLSLFTRIVILAMAAVSLNLIMGFGGMVSFGHAAYIGIGGYAVGILAHEGVSSGFAQWPLALTLSALVALVIGALSLRTRGVYFIMITLAFAQMIYYVGVGLTRYGGDDGLTIYRRSQFGGLVNLANKTVFYYLCFALLLAAGMKGIEEGYELPPGAEDDVWALSDAERRAMGLLPLPGSLAEAISVMERSELVAEALGEHVFEWFIRNKRAEWHEYKTQVSQFELERYLPRL
jgi:hypothetical protein